MRLGHSLGSGAETAGHDHAAIAVDSLADGGQRLVHRLVDEATGVHDDEVRILVGRDGLVTFGSKLGQDALGVHERLGAP